MLCEEVCHSNSTILTLRVGVGSRLRFSDSVMGLAVLGMMQERDRIELQGEIKDQYRSTWPRLEPQFKSAVRQIRERGFCVSLGTLEESVNGVGVPINLPDRPPEFALGCAGPAFLFPRQRLEEELGPRLVELKNQLERALHAHALPKLEAHGNVAK
jgi:DNA-binding IclR family transcriptional regulator